MSGRRQSMAVPRPTSFERGSPYARRMSHKADLRPSLHDIRSHQPRAVPPPPLWSERPPSPHSRSASPPLTALADLTPRLAPRPGSAPIPILLADNRSKLSTDMNPEVQNRLQKMNSKRDRQKQAKEDDYALDPSLVQVVPQQACARCKSQKWKCYILADPSSPRRTCLPCGKNKCTFGGSKSRPATLPPPMPSPMDEMIVQRPRLLHNPAYDHVHHAAASHCSGFGTHRSHSGHMHAHPPPLHLRSFASSFPPSTLPTPELSPSVATDAFPSPVPRTPMMGYFFHPGDRERDSPKTPRAERAEYRSHGDEDMEMSMLSLDLERHSTTSGKSATSGETDPSSPWASQSVIHLIPSDRLRPIPLPSPSEIVSGPARSSPASSPLSSAPTSPRHHAHSIPTAAPSCPPSPHTPLSPLFPPHSPKNSSSPALRSISDLNLPPLRSSALPIPISRGPMSVSSLTSPSLSSPGSTPPSASSFDAPPPTNALFSLLLESAARDPNDPRPILVANDMLGVSEHWVSQIHAARRHADRRDPAFVSAKQDSFRERARTPRRHSSAVGGRPYAEPFRNSEYDRSWGH